MATTTFKEYYPHAGLVWSRVIDLLTQYLTTAGMSWAWTVTTESGYHVVHILLTLSGDTSFYKLFDLDHADTEFYSFDYFFTLPGIRKACPVLPQTKDFLATVDLWDSAISLLRQMFVSTNINCTIALIADTQFTEAQPPTKMVQIVWRLRKGLHLGTDWVAAASLNTGAPAEYQGAQPDFQGQPASAPVMVVGGGGSSIDVDPIVAALNDIALIDVDYTANNGGAVWSMRGKVRT